MRKVNYWKSMARRARFWHWFFPGLRPAANPDCSPRTAASYRHFCSSKSVVPAV